MLPFGEDAAEPLDPAEERALWEAFWAAPADDTLRGRLVELYLPLVIKIVRQVSIRIQNKMRAQELVGSGVIGLHDAISNFSRGGQASFTTFAYKRVKGAILDQLRRQDHLTRNQRQCYKDICAAISRLTLKHRRPPTDAELSEETGLSSEEIQRVIDMATNLVSLNDEASPEGGSHLDFLADERSEGPDEAVDRAMASERLAALIQRLEEREQQVLYLRHHLELSVKEIASVLDVTDGRVCQIYKKTILKLRALMDASL